MLTPEGARILLTNLGDLRIRVSDGTTSAVSPATHEIRGVISEAPTLVVSAMFGVDEANFAWREYAILLGDVAIDVEQGDYGRKQGGEWSVDCSLSLVTSP